VADAADILERAAAAWTPERVSWLQTTIWQKVACEDLTYLAQGRYLSGPGHRLHFYLDVVVGKTHSEVQTVCDGATFWKSTRVGRGKPEITRAALASAFPAADNPQISAEVRAEFLHSEGFTGVYPLLEILWQRMIVTRQEAVSWKGHTATRLTLAWNPSTAGALVPAGQLWPAFLPNRCVLYLDRATLWPGRIEWWAPDGRRVNRLVVQMELHDPILNRPLTKEECDREFSFNPGPAAVPDLTQVIKDELEARSRQLAGG
jgi:hypothetical protein